MDCSYGTVCDRLSLGVGACLKTDVKISFMSLGDIGILLLTGSMLVSNLM